MMCYRDRSYCSDADACTKEEGKCYYVLTPSDAKRAAHLQLPIAWMSFKDSCIHYEEKKTNE